MITDLYLYVDQYGTYYGLDYVCSKKPTVLAELRHLAA